MSDHRSHEGPVSSRSGSDTGNESSRAPAQRRRGVVHSRHFAVIVTAVLGIVASIGAFFAALSWEHAATELDFNSRGQRFVDAVNREIAYSSSLLYTVGAYVETTGRELNRRQFERFAKDLHDRAVGLRNVGWAPRVTREQRPAFERGAFTGSRFGQAYRIVERLASGSTVRAGDRPVLYPVFFMQTSLRYQPPEVRRVRGFDLLSEPERAAGIARAIRTRQPAATRPLELITVRGHSGGVIAFMPVGLQSARPNESPVPVGVVFEVFDISVMVESIIAQRVAKDALNLYLFDAAGGPDRRLIYWHPAHPVGLPPPAESALREGLHWQGSVSMIDQRWGALVTPAAPMRWIDESWQAVLTLAAGLMLTAAIVAHLLISLRRTAVLEGLTASLRVTTDQLQENFEQIAHMAHHDALTGLPNRLLFRERIEAGLTRFPRDAPCAILYLDLDHFKNVNDTLGHDAGDRLLCVVAVRIKSCVREADTVARLGGDEFAILLEHESSVERIANVAERLVGEISQPYGIDGDRVEVGVSIGIAVAADDTKAHTLLKHADIALYEAKAAGRGTYRFFLTNLRDGFEARR